MKKLIILSIVFISLFAHAQEYQFAGTIDGRPATLLLHFVTATDNGGEAWSRGSFYFDDDEEVNVIYQYKPIMPEQGVLTFNLIPNSVGRLDYIKGTLTKQSFKGVYSAGGKETAFEFQAKKFNDFIIYNYYKTKTNKIGAEKRYFGKFIAQDNKSVQYQLTQYLSNSSKKQQPRPYLKSVYDEIVTPAMDQEENTVWLVNYSIFPIISTSDKVVYQVIKNVKKNEEVAMNEEDRFTYDLKTKQVVGN